MNTVQLTLMNVAFLEIHLHKVLYPFKGVLGSSGNIYNINEVIIQTQIHIFQN